MGGVMDSVGPEQTGLTLMGHNFKAGYRNAEGYAVCPRCGYHENEPEAAKPCDTNRERGDAARAAGEG